MRAQDLANHLGLSALTPVGGGSINQAWRAIDDNGQTVFLKAHSSPPSGFFAAEASGLQALEKAGATVSTVLQQGDDFLLLRWIDSAPPQQHSMADLGRMLAHLHENKGPAFGFDSDNYCGTSLQCNWQMRDGHAFFAENRLLPQGQMALQSGLLEKADLAALERLCQRLPELIPEQPPSLIHGDLWSGNVLFDTAGEPVLIDPAVSWCWAEADLAMTRLFGGFDPAFYQAYEAVRPLPTGFEQRVPLYNLYHLLNHLNLFGGGYRASVVRILQPFR